MFGKRSTRDIVISRSRQRQEKKLAEAAALATAQAETPNLPQDPEVQALEPVPETHETQEHKTEELTMKTKLPRWVLPTAAAAAVLVILLALFAFYHPTPAIPDGMSVAALADPALQGAAGTGDVIQVYDGSGHVVPELRYVQVYGASTDGLLLLVDDVQASALARCGELTAVLVARSGDGANELLELQRSLLRPQVTLELPRSLVLEPGETTTAVPEVSMDPEDGILPSLVWSTSDDAVLTVDAEGNVTAGAEEGDATLTVSCGDVSASCTVSVRVALTALVLDRAEGVLVAGETLTLTATPEPGEATGFTVSWTSDNADVATVDADGTVTAIGPGSANITASCGDVSAVCTIRVGVHTELVQFAARSVILGRGEMWTLEYAVSPADNNIDGVGFTSSDENILTVDAEGVVTGVAPGIAAITITHGSATDTCTVTVN